MLEWTHGSPPALQVVGVSRRFGDVQALRDVDLDIRAGEVLAILGENGAGKTTLMRILGGLDRPSSGEVLRAGEPFAPASPREAVERGVTLVQQHFALVPTMDAVDNLLLFRAQRHGARRGRRRRPTCRALAARLDFEIDPTATVASMSVGERQRLELLRALDADPEVLLLDEPTAVLTDAEADRLLDVTRRLAADGRAVVLITHRLREVVEAADRSPCCATASSSARRSGRRPHRAPASPTRWSARSCRRCAGRGRQRRSGRRRDRGPAASDG